MRSTRSPQLTFGQVDISEISFDPQSRDDIPQLLKGLQYIYITPSLRHEIFQCLERHLLADVNPDNGRPGMDLWKILVMGVLRLNLNWDYDRLHEMVNNHHTIRQMLGHTPWEDTTQYKLRTLKNNVSHLTPELLDAIHVIVVRAGHQLVKKKRRNPQRSL